MRAWVLCGFVALAAVPARADVTGMPPVTVICTLHQPFTREGVLADMGSCQPINLPRQATAAELMQAPATRQTTLQDLQHSTREPTWGMPKPPGAP